MLVGPGTPYQLRLRPPQIRALNSLARPLSSGDNSSTGLGILCPVAGSSYPRRHGSTCALDALEPFDQPADVVIAVAIRKDVVDNLDNRARLALWRFSGEASEPV